MADRLMQFVHSLVIGAGRERSHPSPRLCCLIACLLAPVTPPAAAGTLYKSVDSAGRTVYSDVPPTDGRLLGQVESSSLPSTPVPEEILRFRKEMMTRADVRARAAEAMRRSGVTLFTAQWCKYCRNAKAYLAQRGIPYRELDIESEAGREAFAFAGGTGIPLLIRNGTAISGFRRDAYDALLR